MAMLHDIVDAKKLTEEQAKELRDVTDKEPCLVVKVFVAPFGGAAQVTITSDVEKVFPTPSDLMEELPRLLFESMVSQGLVDHGVMVPEGASA